MTTKIVETLDVITDDAYLSLAALSKYAGLSVRTLRDHIDSLENPLPVYRVGRKLLVKRSDYDRWAANFRTEGKPSLVAQVRAIGLPA
jgi:excisionase family DNA binding protein